MLYKFKKIFELEAVTGILLFIATILALLIANSNFGATIYQDFFAINLPIKIAILDYHKSLNLRDWINDALMAIFFLLIGLELKEEMFLGELSSKSRAILPAIAACGGVIVPVLIFYFFNKDYPQNFPAFAVPTATDIAFAYGVLCLFGKKIVKSLKVFLISLAIFDDLIAIFLIAVFYSQDINFLYLALVVLFTGLLAFLSFKKSTILSLYLVIGVFLWLVLLKSGIHATLAGIILAAFIPCKNNILHNLIAKIAPIVNFLILPLFVFANSGINIDKFSWQILLEPLCLGIITGLFFGKQIGIMLFSFIAIKSKIVAMPRDLMQNKISWLEFYGTTIIAGIGFTMSFFIGSLAFLNDDEKFDQIKIGVLCGSLLSAVVGIIIIYFSLTFLKAKNRINTSCD